MRFMKSIFNKDISTLFKSSGWQNLVYLIALVFLSLIMNPIEFGIFRTSYAYIIITSSIVMLGLNASITKYITELTTNEKIGIYIATCYVILITSLAGVLTLKYFTPAINIFHNGDISSYILLCYFFSIFFSSIFQIILSGLQAEYKIKSYANIQLTWKSILFTSAALGGISGRADLTFITMTVSYAISLYFLKRHLDKYHKIRTFKKPSYNKFIFILKKGRWPFASACVSIIYINIEFLYITDSDISSGIAGAYAMASLIFMAGGAFLYPFQTYAVSRVVSKKLKTNELWKLQIICFIATLIFTALSLITVILLNAFSTEKFNDNFVLFSIIVSIKLCLWGAYAITGAVLYHIGKEFESFLLSLISLLVIIAIPWIYNLEASLQIMIKLQLISNIFILLGSSILFLSSQKKNQQ